MKLNSTARGKLFILSGNDWFNIVVIRSLCISKSRHDLGEIQKESSFTARSCQSRWDVENLAANSTEFWETHKHLGEILAKWRRSHRDSETHKHHGEISTNLGEILVISARWRISRRDLAEISNLANIMARSLQISVISSRWRRSRRDLESRKHHGEISTISGRSR